MFIILEDVGISYNEDTGKASKINRGDRCHGKPVILNTKQIAWVCEERLPSNETVTFIQFIKGSGSKGYYVQDSVQTVYNKIWDAEHGVKQETPSSKEFQHFLKIRNDKLF